MGKEIALVTGATAGIGEATAMLLAENGYRLIITGRRQERLDKFKDQLGRLTDVRSLCFDIRNRDEVEKAIDGLPSRWEDIGVLVNNAGLAAGMDHFQDCDVADWEQMIDTNLKGLLYMTRKVAPGMIERGRGHIVNVGSIAGREMYEPIKTST